MRHTVVVVPALALLGCGGGGSDPGLVDCTSFVDKLIECEVIPPATAASVREANIMICNNWEVTYQEDVLTALDGCIDAACPELSGCTYAANQLCDNDTTAGVAALCTKIVECQWEELTTQEVCLDAQARNQALFACLRDDVWDDYVACVTSISCGPDGESDWYACAAAHIQ